MNDLPTAMYGADSVPFGDAFLLVGGADYNTAQTLDTILSYNPNDDTWIEMPSKLTTPRVYPTVIPVKRSIFPSC